MESTLSQVLNSFKWSEQTVLFPASGSSWALVLGTIVLFLSIVSWIAYRLRPRSKNTGNFGIVVRNASNNDADNQTAYVALSTGRWWWPERYGQSAVIDDHVILSGPGGSARVLLKSHRGTGTDKLSVSPGVAKQLGIDAVPEGEKRDVDVSLVWWNLLARTIWHPDPNIHLQWALGFWFLVLGYIVPKIIDSLADIAL